MPELPNYYLMTDRIALLHKALSNSRVAIVCAPAGYGKTSLVSSYFTYSGYKKECICWYRLGLEDSNPLEFIVNFIEALFPSTSQQFSSIRDFLEENNVKSMDSREAVSILCQEMWLICNNEDNKKYYIVLDDFQNAASSEEVKAAVRQLVDNLPSCCSVFIISRTNSSLFTEKQKLETSIMEIGAKELVFQKQEIKELLHSLAATDPSALLEEVMNRSEGWITGILLLNQTIKSKLNGIAAISSDPMLPNESLFRYLSSEVMKGLSPSAHDLLEKLSILQDFSAQAACEIFGIDQVGQLLFECRDFEMFIQKLPGSPVVYHFHSLFNEFLMSRLQQSYSEEQLVEYRLTAAQYYIRHFQPIRAAEYLALCGNSIKAMELVIQIGFDRLMIGETLQLKTWLGMLPQASVDSNPVLLLYKVQTLPNSRQSEYIPHLKQLMSISLEENHMDLYLGAAFLLFYILICDNDMKSLQEITAKLPVQQTGNAEAFGSVLTMLHIVHAIGEEQYSHGASLIKRTHYIKLQEDLQHLYLCYACIHFYCLGKLDQAERCMRAALKLDNTKTVKPAYAFDLLFLSIVLCLKNDRIPLRQHIREIASIGDQYELEFLSAYAKRLAAYDRYICFDTSGACDDLDYAIYYFNKMGNLSMTAACRLQKLLWADLYNPDTLEEADKALAVIKAAQPGMLVYETSLSIYGTIVRSCGELIKAETSFLEAAAIAKKHKATQTLCGIALQLAKLYFDTSRPEKGRQWLSIAMELAESNSYFMFWDLHLPTLLEMSLKSIYCGIHARFAEELLQCYFGSRTTGFLSEKARNMSEKQLGMFCRQFTGTFKPESSMHHYFVRANLFGKPVLQINGTAIEETEWKTKKIKGLLEYLLFYCGKTLSKDYLAEKLWPESDSGSAMVSLRTALYQLRKTLSKYGADVTGPNAFIYETLSGLQIRRNEAISLDLFEYSNLFNDFVTTKKNSPDSYNEQIEILSKMLALYVGDLMEGSDQIDPVFFERERCKMLFEEASLQLSSIHEANGDSVQAETILLQAFSVDPYSENVCLALILLLISTGRKNKALELYHSYKKRIEFELKVQIDKRLTEAVYGKRA